jgi:hypothetical protein
MQKISSLFINRFAPAAATSTTANAYQSTKITKRAFSIQTEMQSFDFSDKLNVEELKLKNPTNT